MFKITKTIAKDKNNGLSKLFKTFKKIKTPIFFLEKPQPTTENHI